MTWKKHSKKVSEIVEKNTEIDMTVRKRFDEMLAEAKDKDIAVSLEFLKEYLHLEKTDDGAIQELKLMVDMKDDLRYAVLVDDTDQSVYIQFLSPEKEE